MDNTNPLERVELFRRANQLQEFYRVAFASALARSGLEPISPAWSHILDVLRSNGPMQMTAIARATHRTKANVTLGIRCLEELGLVTRETDKYDARVSIITMTEKGHQYDAVLSDMRHMIVSQIFRGIPIAELMNMASVLERIGHNIETFRP